MRGVWLNLDFSYHKNMGRISKLPIFENLKFLSTFGKIIFVRCEVYCRISKYYKDKIPASFYFINKSKQSDNSLNIESIFDNNGILSKKIKNFEGDLYSS